MDDDKLRLKSKRQTEQISEINAEPIESRYASIGQLTKTGLKLDIIDPTEAARDAYPIKIHPALFIHLAYRTVFDLVSLREATQIVVRDQTFRMVSVPDADLTVGLRADIFEILNRATSWPTLDRA